jgi:FkbM family methyltransferase
MISYAQNAEDVVLARVFADVPDGFYVDVGASSPVDDSVTFHFYERGWHGVNVEPDPGEYVFLVAAREKDVNLHAVVGSGDEPVAFYPSAVRGHGTVDATRAVGRGDTTTVEVPQVSLARILAEHAPPEGVDFLKVDVEGWEADVLASADWEQHKPRVVVVEAVDADGRPTHDEWQPDLLAAGYQLALFDGLNRFFCRDDDADTLLPRLAAPANVLDNWRPRREVAAQERLQWELDELAQQHAAARADLDRVSEAREAAQNALATARRALEAEQHAHEGTRSALAGIYQSTSWRITAPVRDASRLARLMQRESGA